MYIGITSVPLAERWDNGFGYEQQPKFFREIVKYGWDNIKHEVLATCLSEKDARNMEKDLIEREGNNVLNTQHCGGMDLSWLKSVINQDSPDIRFRKFRQFNDRWLDKVRLDGTVPYRWDINDEYIELGYVIQNGNVLIHSILRVSIPANITYQKLYHYICWELNFDRDKVVVLQENTEVSV